VKSRHSPWTFFRRHVIRRNIIRLKTVMVKMTTRWLAYHVRKDTLVILRFDEVVIAASDTV